MGEMADLEIDRMLDAYWGLDFESPWCFEYKPGVRAPILVPADPTDFPLIEND